MMSKEIIIVVAPVPGEKQDEKYPGPLDVPEEVIRCEEAGAAIAHLHARDADLLQTVDPTLFQEHVRLIRKACPIIIEGSTGGAPEHTLDQRCVTFTIPEVEMGSLNLGSVNMFDGVYQNRYEDICFYARKLAEHRIVPHARVRPVAPGQLPAAGRGRRAQAALRIRVRVRRALRSAVH